MKDFKILLSNKIDCIVNQAAVRNIELSARHGWSIGTVYKNNTRYPIYSLEGRTRTFPLSIILEGRIARSNQHQDVANILGIDVMLIRAFCSGLCGSGVAASGLYRPDESLAYNMGNDLRLSGRILT